jgi:hypothetical protein
MQFKENKTLTDPNAIEEAITFGELQLETIEIQAAHLGNLATGYKVEIPEGLEDPHAHKKAPNKIEKTQPTEL